MVSKEARDARRREELIRTRKGRGRPPGLTPISRHNKRFESALWLTLRDHLKCSYVDAGRLAFVMLQLEPRFQVEELGHGYVAWQGACRIADDDFDRRYHDMQKTARILLARSKRYREHDDWLYWSQLALAVLLRAPFGSQAALFANLELHRLGWSDVLAGICKRIDQVPATTRPADPKLIKRFLRHASRRGLAVARN